MIKSTPENFSPVFSGEHIFSTDWHGRTQRAAGTLCAVDKRLHNLPTVKGGGGNQ